MMGLTSFVAAIFFGSIMYNLERGHFTVDLDHPHGFYEIHTTNGIDNGVSSYSSALAGAYYTVVTLTTGRFNY
jgi:hypothetical protein